MLGQDVGVGARLEREDRRLELRRPLRRPRLPVSLTRGAVEADRAGEPVPARRREPRIATAEAEADREHGRTGAAVRGAQVLDGRPHVLLDPVGCRLRHVLHVRELVVALVDARGATEVVESNRGIAALGEAKRELLVEAIEPADVRQDDDTHRPRLVRPGRERGEPGSVGGLEGGVFREDGGAAREDGDRRQRVELEAHHPARYRGGAARGNGRAGRRPTN